MLFRSEPNLLVRACNQLGQFLQHRETNLRYLALESMCTLASSEFSHEAVKTHIETVINALKVKPHTWTFYLADIRRNGLILPTSIIQLSLVYFFFTQCTLALKGVQDYCGTLRVA